MEDHFQRHTEAMETIRALCATGMNAVDATRVVIEDLGRDAFRASPEESDWNTAHRLLEILVDDYKADQITAMNHVIHLFGRPSIQDHLDRLMAAYEQCKLDMSR